jgi:hypothetical protein
VEKSPDANGEAAKNTNKEKDLAPLVTNPYDQPKKWDNVAQPTCGPIIYTHPLI